MPSACSCTPPLTTWSTCSACSCRSPGARRRSKPCAHACSNSAPACAKPPAASASTWPPAGLFRTCSAPPSSPSTAVDPSAGPPNSAFHRLSRRSRAQNLSARHPYALGSHTLALLTPLIAQSLPTNCLANQNLSPHELSRLDVDSEIVSLILFEIVRSYS